MKPIRSCIRLIILLLIFSAVYVYHQFNKIQLSDVSEINIEVNSGESVNSLANKLEAEGVIKSASWFKRYLQIKGLDTKINAGNFVITGPVTLENIVNTLTQEVYKQESKITILPGWDNRDVAAYLAAEGFGNEEEIFALIGKSAIDYRENPQQTIDTSAYKFASTIPSGAGLEGYLSPNTYRVFANASAKDVINKLLAQRNIEITPELIASAESSGRNFYDIMIMASLLEREVRGAADKKMVADIFWKRLDNGWPLQADSTVHYLTGKKGNVFTTAADRNTDSPYNTYKYSGLPLGPIANPSITAIEAAINPTPNDYWYFITTLDTGEAKYGKTLDEHNANVNKYLRNR